MPFDNLSVSLMVAALILGPLTIIMVGSQTRENARSINFWTLCVLVPVFLATCVGLACSGGPGGSRGGAGFLMLCTAMIASVEIEYRIASVRGKTVRDTAKVKKSEPGVWDVELI